MPKTTLSFYSTSVWAGTGAWSIPPIHTCAAIKMSSVFLRFEPPPLAGWVTVAERDCTFQVEPVPGGSGEDGSATITNVSSHTTEHAQVWLPWLCMGWVDEDQYGVWGVQVFKWVMIQN